MKLSASTPRAPDVDPFLDVEVDGTPRPQGSMRIINGHAIHNDSMLEWRGMVALRVRDALPDDWETLAGIPVAVRTDFTLDRPKKHFKASGMILRDDAPSWVFKAPDADKLARCIGDALTNSGVVKDDSLFALWRISKQYVNAPGARSLPGVRVRLWRL